MKYFFRVHRPLFFFLNLLLSTYTFDVYASEWGPWQRFPSSDPTMPLEIQFKSPHDANAEGVGTWYWRLRNTSSRQGICATYQLSTENEKGTHEWTQDVRLNPGETEQFYGGSWTIGKYVRTVAVLHLAPFDGRNCGASKSTEGGAGSGSSSGTSSKTDEESAQTYMFVGLAYCRPNITFQYVRCLCPSGTSQEYSGVSAYICRCPENTHRWDEGNKRCEKIPEAEPVLPPVRATNSGTDRAASTTSASASSGSSPASSIASGESVPKESSRNTDSSSSSSTGGGGVVMPPQKQYAEQMGELAGAQAGAIASLGPSALENDEQQTKRMKGRKSAYVLSIDIGLKLSSFPLISNTEKTTYPDGTYTDAESSNGTLIAFGPSVAIGFWPVYSSHFGFRVYGEGNLAIGSGLVINPEGGGNVYVGFPSFRIIGGSSYGWRQLEHVLMASGKLDYTYLRYEGGVSITLEYRDEDEHLPSSDFSILIGREDQSFSGAKPTYLRALFSYSALFLMGELGWGAAYGGVNTYGAPYSEDANWFQFGFGWKIMDFNPY